MRDEFRQLVIETLRRGEDLPVEWARELFPPEKREYELIYYGKEREEDIIAETMAIPLQPVRTFIRNADGDNETLFRNALNGNSGEEWRNMLILGDNLQVLKTLLEMKNSGLLSNADGTPGIRLIYIDPPFATKQDFHGSQTEKAYRDKISGAEFIEFLRKRLVMLHELLASDGSIFVHLDQRKVQYIKVILDEIFREHNFRNEIGWRYSGWNKRLIYAFEKRRDSILFYGKGPNQKFNSYSEPWKNIEEYIRVRKQKVLVDEDDREYVLSDAGNGWTAPT